MSPPKTAASTQVLVGYRVPLGYSAALAQWAAEVGVAPSELSKAALEHLAATAAPNSSAAAAVLAESRRIARRRMWAHAIPAPGEESASPSMQEAS